MDLNEIARNIGMEQPLKVNHFGFLFGMHIVAIHGLTRLAKTACKYSNFLKSYVDLKN